MSRQTIAHVPVELLTEHPDNVRDTLGDLREMADSIRQHGILQPLTATEDVRRDGKLLLLAGHRRLRGAIMAGLPVVPVIIRHDVTDPVDHTVLMLVENTQRRELDPLERAKAYGRLRDQGLSGSEIARRTGVHTSTVSHYLNLLLLSTEEQEEVRQGELGTTRAIERVRGRRKAQRDREGRAARGRPSFTPFYFGPTHRLAESIKASCDHDEIKVGGVGCGPCWERAIAFEAFEKTAAAS